jgi:hypothetical protein
MAVLVEAISVVVRRSAISTKYAGGWSSFAADVPNATLCSDDDISRVGFMNPADVETYIALLRGRGLQFLSDEKFVDIAVVDQQRGPTMACDWLEFAKLNFGDRGKVSACWLFEGPRIAAGVHLPAKQMDLATPAGWTYEGSFSEKFVFVPLTADKPSE